MIVCERVQHSKCKVNIHIVEISRWIAQIRQIRLRLKTSRMEFCRYKHRK